MDIINLYKKKKINSSQYKVMLNMDNNMDI